MKKISLSLPQKIIEIVTNENNESVSYRGTLLGAKIVSYYKNKSGEIVQRQMCLNEEGEMEQCEVFLISHEKARQLLDSKQQGQIDQDL